MLNLGIATKVARWLSWLSLKLEADGVTGKAVQAGKAFTHQTYFLMSEDSLARKSVASLRVYPRS